MIKLWLNKTQVYKFRKAFANNLPAVVKFSKHQLFKMVQLVGVTYDLLNFAMDLEKSIYYNAKKLHDLARKVPSLINHRTLSKYLKSTGCD